MTEEKLTALVRTFGTPVTDADPGEIVMQRIGTLAGHVRWLQARVESLTPDELVWNRTRVKVGGQDNGMTEEARPHVWLELYQRWDQQLQRLCLEALRIGIREREVRLAEAMGATICTMIDGVLAELGHDGSDPKTAAVVARHLKLVAEVQETTRGQLEAADTDDDAGNDDEQEVRVR